MIEPSTPTRDCPNPEKWSAWDSDTCELEVLDFLAQLIDLLKPNYVVETGTCFGYSANAMAQADSNVIVVTCDPEEKPRPRPLPPNVFYYQCSSLDFTPNKKIDLLFLDSALELRAKEYFHFLPFLSAQAVVVIHDTGETHAEFLAEVRKTLSSELDFVILPTPRGLLIGRPKVSL